MKSKRTRAAAPRLRCPSQSPGELLIILILRSTPTQIKSECLGVGAKHQNVIKSPNNSHVQESLGTILSKHFYLNFKKKLFL